MQTTLIRRFSASDQVTHFLNSIAWIVLGISGIAIGSALRAGEDPSHAALGAHFVAGALLAAVLLVYAAAARGRFARMLYEIFRRDRHFLAWLKCLGGYPQKLLGLPLDPHCVPPQGRYNAGQRVAYAALIGANFTLVGSGFALFLMHDPANGASAAYERLRALHSCAFALSLFVLCAHIPMGRASGVPLRAILRFGQGWVPVEHARKASPLWVAQDLEVERIDGDRTLLRERSLGSRK